MLSSFRVSFRPASCLRYWCSTRYLRIPPLHLVFRLPLRYSSPPVPTARARLSLAFPQQTRRTAYELFTPNNSGQRLYPTYYRGCWHVVSRYFFCRYRHPKASSLLKEVYNPKAVIPHAASLHQGFPHCAIFPTAASRRSLGRVSVPMWPSTLSGRLLIVALVGRYPANWLIRRRSISHRRSFSHRAMRPCALMRY